MRLRLRLHDSRLSASVPQCLSALVPYCLSALMPLCLHAFMHFYGGLSIFYELCVSFTATKNYLQHACPVVF